MARSQPDKVERNDLPDLPWKLRYHPDAVQEVLAGVCKERVDELAYFLHLLGGCSSAAAAEAHWEDVCRAWELTAVEHNGKRFFTSLIDVGGHQGREGVSNVLVYFFGQSASRTIWVLHAHRAGLTARVTTALGVVYTRVVRRLRDIDGHYQDLHNGGASHEPDKR